MRRRKASWSRCPCWRARCCASCTAFSSIARAAARRHHRPGHRHRRAADRLALGIEAIAQVLLLGVHARRRRRILRGRLPLASRWYPPQYQGIALGIAGAGNSGTVFASLFAPGLAARSAGHNVFGLAAIPLPSPSSSTVLLAQGQPERPPPKSLPSTSRCAASAMPGGSCSSTPSPSAASPASPRRSRSTSTTDYGLDAVAAGYFAAAVRLLRFAGAADRRRARRPHRRHRALSLMYVVAAVALVVVSFPAAGVAGTDAVRPRHAGASAWATARCSSSCRSASVTRSA